MLRPSGGAAFFIRKNRAKPEAPRGSQRERQLHHPPEVLARRLFGVPQRTFSVARPIIARISEMIQKRITICGSAQPFFS